MSTRPETKERRDQRVEIRLRTSVWDKLHEHLKDARKPKKFRGELIDQLLYAALIEKKTEVVLVRLNAPDAAALEEIREESKRLNCVWNDIRAKVQEAVTYEGNEAYRAWKDHDNRVDRLCADTENLVSKVEKSCELWRQLDSPTLMALVNLYDDLHLRSPESAVAKHGAEALLRLLPDLPALSLRVQASRSKLGGNAS